MKYFSCLLEELTFYAINSGVRVLETPGIYNNIGLYMEVIDALRNEIENISVT